jgi:hypothetical protein
MKTVLALLLLSGCMGWGQTVHHRSSSVRERFMRTHPCPANGHTKGSCPGYVVDHIVPLRCGGQDAPGNLQWQTVAQGKAKDKWERKCVTSGG